MKTAIEAFGVRKAYKTGRSEVHAVAGVSLAIKAQEMVAIVGPSGSGKSTLLNLLGALDKPDAGEIVVAGIKLSELDDAGRTRMRREKIGLIFQFFNLLPLLTARENVTLPLLLAGVNRAEADKRAEDLLARVGLGGRSDHTPEEMSGGEMQRVAVARALAPRPPVLLADEPTGNLDTQSGSDVLTLLRSAAREQGCAIIMVTHDPRAAAVTDRVLEFRDGRLVGEKAPSSFSNNPLAGAS
jgi:putative ABC transport system ATP-binding protein